MTEIEHASKNYILTQSSSFIYFDSLEDNYYELSDISNALSKLCRFTGHTKNFYSVAQHSVMVSYNVPQEYALEGLLHDATEAYLGDVSSPLKALLPDYKKIEKSLYASIAKQYNLPENISEEVKKADMVLLATERRDLMPHSDDKWDFLEGVIPLEHEIVPMHHTHAKQFFELRYYEILNEISSRKLEANRA